MMHVLYVLQYAKCTCQHQTEPVALAIMELHLSEGRQAITGVVSRYSYVHLP